MKKTVPLIALACVTMLGTNISGVQAQTNSVTQTEVPASSDAFANSIGFDSAYETHKYPAKVTQELLWSKIKHLRDGPPVSDLMISTFKYLGQHGVNHAIGEERGFSADTVKKQLTAFEPYVDYIEPANEADNFKDPNWSQMRSDQQRLYSTVRANKAWNNVAVYGPSFANPAAHAALVGPLDQYENFGVLHNATCDWNPGSNNFGSGIEANIIKIRPTTRYKAIVTTETGYTDDFSRGCSLPSSVAAKYIPRESALRFMAGMSKTYFDFLVVKPQDKVFGGLGMLEANGNPKPQFMALGNLMHLTINPGTQAARTPVQLTINNATADIEHLLLKRTDGSYTLLIWREVSDWDHHTRHLTPMPSISVNVQLPVGANKLEMFHDDATQNPLTRTQLVLSSKGLTQNFGVSDTITALHFYKNGQASL